MMKGGILITLFILSFFCCSAQTAQAVLATKGNQKNWLISVSEKGAAPVNCFANCEFKPVAGLPDSIKLQLISVLMNGISDTATSYMSVEYLHHRFLGQRNQQPNSTKYNAQISALLLINCLAFTTDAFYYSPYPVLYNSKTKQEITMAGKDLNCVIKKYRKWVKKLEKTGLKNYELPLFDKKYEWFDTAFKTQRNYVSPPKWSILYDCLKIMTLEE